jgi:hypothetical protein
LKGSAVKTTLSMPCFSSVRLLSKVYSVRNDFSRTLPSKQARQVRIKTLLLAYKTLHIRVKEKRRCVEIRIRIFILKRN